MGGHLLALYLDGALPEQSPLLIYTSFELLHANTALANAQSRLLLLIIRQYCWPVGTEVVWINVFSLVSLTAYDSIDVWKAECRLLKVGWIMSLISYEWIQLRRSVFLFALFCFIHEDALPDDSSMVFSYELESTKYI